LQGRLAGARRAAFLRTLMILRWDDWGVLKMARAPMANSRHVSFNHAMMIEI
jgi:hypothetical protein